MNRRGFFRALLRVAAVATLGPRALLELAAASAPPVVGYYPSVGEWDLILREVYLPELRKAMAEQTPLWDMMARNYKGEQWLKISPSSPHS